VEEVVEGCVGAEGSGVGSKVRGDLMPVMDRNIGV
jgi:hypothetical protein